MLNTELNDSVKPCLNYVCIDCSMSCAVNLTSPYALNVRISNPEAIDPVFANRLETRRW